MKTFSADDRNRLLQNLSETHYDLVIIGGGINGAGIARDASMRGMKVILVEADDFASGTSSRSSKLIHGGIRYLENLEFHLVFEALSERAKLFKMAPHLVHPLRFMLPLYKSGRVGMFKMGLGMWLYDALSLFRTPKMHERLSSEKTKQRMPDLKDSELLGSYVYSDAYMDDDRLVFETLRSANQFGAHCLNYVRASDAKLNASGKVESIEVVDQFTSIKHRITGKHFVSTVGAWTDIVGNQFFKNWKNILRPTKGVHLTFEKNRLPLSSAVVMAAENRIVFGIPRHEMVIVGTTDTDFSGDPSNVVTMKADVEYLLEVIGKYFPGAKIKQSDILSCYAGVRPLVDDGAETEGKTSREHTIFTDDHDVTFVAGGKYTTYRLISEQAVDHCLKIFPVEERKKFKKVRTDRPLNPFVSQESYALLSDLRNEIAAHTGWGPIEASWFADRHGQEVWEILKVHKAKSYWETEALHAIDQTMCVSLRDFYMRRTHLFLAMKDHGLSLLPQLARQFEIRLGWSEHQKQSQMDLLKNQMRHELQWRNESIF